MKEQTELKELKKMQKFLEDHPRTKAGHLWNDEFKAILELSKGETIRIAIYCFQVGFMRGYTTRKKHMMKERKGA